MEDGKDAVVNTGTGGASCRRRAALFFSYNLLRLGLKQDGKRKQAQLDQPQLTTSRLQYFPSPLPTTRLSVSTTAVPAAPSPTARPPTFKSSANRGKKSKFRDSLGGLQEEEGEEVLSIVRGPEPDDEEGSGVWAVLGREDVSVWSIRVRLSHRSCARASKLTLLLVSPRWCSRSSVAPHSLSARMAPTRLSSSTLPLASLSPPPRATTSSTLSLQPTPCSPNEVTRRTSSPAGIRGVRRGPEGLEKGGMLRESFCGRKGRAGWQWAMESDGKRVR